MNDLVTKYVFGELTIEEVFGHLKNRLSSVGVCFVENGKQTPLLTYRQWWTDSEDFILFERDEESYERRLSFPRNSKIKIFKEHVSLVKDGVIIKIVFHETKRINLSNFVPEANKEVVQALA